MLKYDIVIIGAGTAGTFAAYNLAKNGLKVALIEMKSKNEIGNKVCGDAIGGHHFKNTGLEPPKIGYDAEGEIRGVRIFSPDKKNFITAIGNGYALNRYNFGQRLLKMSLDANSELYDAYYAMSPLVDKDQVKGIKIKSLKNGQKKLLLSKVLIDASGALSIVRSKLPKNWWVSFIAPKEDFNSAYREVIELNEEIEIGYASIYLDLEIAPGGYWWLFPKNKTTINIGLGVQWKENMPNPKMQFEKYIKPLISSKVKKVIHRGAGLVPTRRPAPCMVWNGFLAIGDAAYTANPIHGGGIGPSLLSALLASETIIKALEIGEENIESLWDYQRKYHEKYGAKQASLDILRMYLQRLTNYDLNFIFNNKIVSNEEILDIGYEGEIRLSILKKLNIALRLIKRSRILLGVKTVKDYMDKIRKLYLNYPEDPKDYPKWKNNVDKVILEYKNKIKVF